MKIVRDDYEIEQVRAWAQEAKREGRFHHPYSYEAGYDDAYSEAILALIDWLTGQTTQDPTR